MPFTVFSKKVPLHYKLICISTIIINNPNKEEVNVISKLAKLLKLNVTTKKQEVVSSKAAIDAAIQAYETGSTKGLKISVQDFKKLVNGAKKDH